MLASAVGGLLTRTLVSSQVECVTENAPVYSFHMLMWLLCDFNAAKLFLGVNIFVVSIPALVSQQWTDSKAPHSFIKDWDCARERDTLSMGYMGGENTLVEYFQCKQVPTFYFKIGSHYLC